MQDIQSSLNLSPVNFNNIEEVAGFAGRLMHLGNSLGVLSGDKRLQSREAIAIYQAVKGFDKTKLSGYDIQSRVKILLDADLYAYEGRKQGAFKKLLAEQYNYYLETN